MIGSLDCDSARLLQHRVLNTCLQPQSISTHGLCCTIDSWLAYGTTCLCLSHERSRSRWKVSMAAILFMRNSLFLHGSCPRAVPSVLYSLTALRNIEQQSHCPLLVPSFHCYDLVGSTLFLHSMETRNGCGWPGGLFLLFTFECSI
jgi:hypothetical protein